MTSGGDEHLSISRLDIMMNTESLLVFYQLHPQCVSEVDGIKEEEINTNDK